MARLGSNIGRLAVLALLLMPREGDGTFHFYTGFPNGASANPPTASTGTGMATLTYDDVAQTLRVQFTFSGLTNPASASHVHCCVTPPMNVGVAVAFPSFPAATSGAYDHTFGLTSSGTYNSTFLTNNGGTSTGAASALLTGLANGTAYIDIHTSIFPGGEIRSFLCADAAAPVVTPPAAVTVTQTTCQ